MTTALRAPAQPRYLTPRTAGLGTYGPAIGKVAAALGRAPMPWQRLAHDVIGEVYPDGRFRHPLVVVTVPRQAGKTDGVATPVIVHRCLYRPRQFAWFTAQNGKYAADKWGEQVDVIRADGSPLFELTRKPRRARGSEVLTFVNGSTFAPHPPTRDGLHSKQGDLNVVDEGWAHDALEGDALMQAIVPIQATRPYRQTIVMSTEGDARSVWFAELVDRGREGDPGVCLIDYGVPLDFEDADDLDTVASFHPAFGFTMDMQALVDARAQLKPDEFLRAYGNKRTGATERIIPIEPWGSAAFPSLDQLAADPTRPTIPAGQAVVFGVAVAEDRSDAAIVAGALVDGVPHFEVVDVRPGTSWVVPRMRQLKGSHRVLGWVVDRIGPAGAIAREAERAGFTLHAFGPQDLAAACSDVLARIAERDVDGLWKAPRLRYRPHDQLDAAAAIAARRRIGDGAWLWHRRGSAGSIATLEALTLALLAVLGSGPLGKPVIRC